MRKISTRAATFDDLDEVVRIEKEAWPPEIQASREKFESRLSIFPEGFILVCVDDEIAGVSTSEIIDYDPGKEFTWEEITDHGWIRKTHKPDGNALYVVSVGVSPRYQGMGCGTALVEAQKQLAIRKKLQYVVLGARLPWYHRYRHLSPEAYLAMRKPGTEEAFDPEIRFYERCGLKRARIVENYMENDPESLNYGVIMYWKNDKV